MKIALPSFLTIACIGILTAPVARAGFHLYDIQEIYSNGDGSVQFVELFTANGSQQFLTGHELWVRDGSNAIVEEFIFLTDGPSPTANTNLLLATSNFSSLYGVTPDFVIPANFLSGGAGLRLDFDGQDSVSLEALPADGFQSVDGVFNNGNTPGTYSINANATPTNFAGETASVPEPSAILLGLGALLGLGISRRRS